MERSIDLNTELNNIARLGLMAKIEQGFALIDGLKVIESVEIIVNSGIVELDLDTSVRVIDSRYDLEAALVRCASVSIDAVRALVHDAPGVNSQAILEDEWYAGGETNSVDSDSIRALKVICSATSLMNTVAQPVDA